MNIGIEKVNIHKEVTVKVLLDSGTTGMFIDRKMMARHGFRLHKLERPVQVRNIDSTNNSAEAITHQVKVNMYYKNHVERIRMDICDLCYREVVNASVITLDGCSRRTRWSSSLDCSSTYTTVTVAVP